MKPKINTYSKFQMSYNLFQFSCPKRLLWGKEKSRDDCCYYARFHILILAVVKLDTDLELSACIYLMMWLPRA